MRNAIERHASLFALAGLLAVPVGCGSGANPSGSGSGGSSETGGKTGSGTGGKKGGGTGGSNAGGQGGDDPGGSGGSAGGSTGSSCMGVRSMVGKPSGLQFGAHPMKYPAGSIRPTGDQAVLDDVVRCQYDKWKAAYLKQDCGGYYVLTNGGAGAGAETFVTVSEGHGYGMIIAALMAGTEPKAQEIFDGMYAVKLQFPSTVDKDLMSWGIDKGCGRVKDGDAATDGDEDMAFALLLADKQWGSAGKVNYLAEAKKLITAIGRSEINGMTKLPLLGDWATPDDVTYYWITRPSDFMVDHYRAYGKATDSTVWNDSISAIYKLIDFTQANLSPKTGLIPDFIRDTNTPMPTVVPVSFANDVRFLGEDLKTDFDYNSCRVPWHLGTDYLVTGDAAVKARVAKMNAFIRQRTGEDPDKIVDGYSLAGEPWAKAGPHDCFTAGFGVAGLVDASNQKWVDGIWAHLADAQVEDYYGDTIRLISMIVMSGNWWTP
jgi:endo-1,4-beta-D-glucanase Y